MHISTQQQRLICLRCHEEPLQSSLSLSIPCLLCVNHKDLAFACGFQCGLLQNHFMLIIIMLSDIIWQRHCLWSALFEVVLLSLEVLADSRFHTNHLFNKKWRCVRLDYDYQDTDRNGIFSGILFPVLIWISMCWNHSCYKLVCWPASCGSSMFFSTWEFSLLYLLLCQLRTLNLATIHIAQGCSYLGKSNYL